MKPTLLFLFLLTVCQAVHAKEQTSNRTLCESIHQAIGPFSDNHVFSGNLLLAKGGKVLCQFSTGFSDNAQETPIKQNDRFPIASLSKPLVATLVLKLQEQGILDLQASVAHYLPDYSAPWANDVTLHHLLANRSGLPGHFVLPGFKSGAYSKTLNQQTLLDDIAQTDLIAEPGTEYVYTNLGWTLLVEIIEVVTDKELQETIIKHLFTPLSMNDSGVVINAKQPLIAGFQWGENGGRATQKDLPLALFGGGAGLYSTTSDLLQYLYAVHQGDLLSSNSKQLLFSKDAPYGWRNETLSLGTATQKRVHGYDGQLLGHSSFVYQELDEQTSLILLTNSSMGYAHKKALADDVLSVYFDQTYPNRSGAPSLVLHKSLINRNWESFFNEIQQKPIQDVQTAVLINDLAQQLDWAGNFSHAIDLYSWLSLSFPENQGLKGQRDRLCNQHGDHQRCKPKGKINVGMAVMPLADNSRNAWRSNKPRPVKTHMFYPTEDQNAQPFMLGPKHAPMFSAGEVVHNAKLISGKRPLILMSHGTGGSAPQLLWLATALVKQGYVVAAVNHHGNTAIEDKKYPEGFLLWWERARDLQFVRKQLLQDTDWKQFIDSEKVAVVGFSLGGYTAVSALGGITDKAQFDAYCSDAVDDFSCQPQPEFQTVLEEFEVIKHSAQVIESRKREHESNLIPELKAAIVIAPAIMHAFRPSSLEAITTPTRFIVGDKDEIAPSKPNSEYAQSLLANSELNVIENGHHYSFLSICTDRGKDVLKDLCAQPHGKTRNEVHQEAIQLTVSFLQQHL